MTAAQITVDETWWEKTSGKDERWVLQVLVVPPRNKSNTQVDNLYKLWAKQLLNFDQANTLKCFPESTTSCSDSFVPDSDGRYFV